MWLACLVSATQLSPDAADLMWSAQPLSEATLHAEGVWEPVKDTNSSLQLNNEAEVLVSYSLATTAERRSSGAAAAWAVCRSGGSDGSAVCCDGALADGGAVCCDGALAVDGGDGNWSADGGVGGVLARSELRSRGRICVHNPSSTLSTSASAVLAPAADGPAVANAAPELPGPELPGWLGAAVGAGRGRSEGA